MPNIEIIELDETTSGAGIGDTDIVYVPGFVDITQTCLYKKDVEGNITNEYIGIQPNTPTLFTSVADFERLCGTQGVVFKTTQKYSNLRYIDTNGKRNGGFDGYAVPIDQTMFKANDTDPSYVIAKELLNAGLGVLYERMNDQVTFNELTDKPQDWDKLYQKYYTSKVIKQRIDTTSAPMWYQKLDAGTLLDRGKDYYIATYKQVDGKPTNEIQSFTLFNPYADIEISSDKNYYKKEVKGDKAFLEGLCFTKTTEDDIDIYVLLTESAFNELEDTDIFYYKVDQPEVTTDHDIYMHNGISYYRLNATEVTDLSVPFIKDTFYIVDEISGEFKLVENSSDFGIDGVRYFTLNYEDITVTNNQLNIVPDNWSIDYVNYYEDIEVISDKPIGKLAEEPDFEDYEKVYELDDGCNIVNMYKKLGERFGDDSVYGLLDKGNYDFKYLTSGGYPVYEYNSNSLTNSMLDLCAKRGDCVALIDHTNNPTREDDIDTQGSLYYSVSNKINGYGSTFTDNGEFGAMFTPYCKFVRSTVDKDDKGTIPSDTVYLPASVAYLLSLADSIKTNANWLAVAGSARGVVPNLAPGGVTVNIPNGAADKMQPTNAIAVNAITNIKPYGWTIWGNRTLKDNSSKHGLIASSFLNIRNLVSDIKKTCYTAARILTFEQNNDILWVNFKSYITKTLDKMKTGYGISNYKIVRDMEHEKAQEKATLCAKVILYPVYAVENFYITIVLKDDEITVE